MFVTCSNNQQTEEEVNFVSPVREGPGELQEVPRVPPAVSDSRLNFADSAESGVCAECVRDLNHLSEQEAESEVAVGRPTGTDRRTLPPSPPGSPRLR